MRKALLNPVFYIHYSPHLSHCENDVVRLLSVGKMMVLGGDGGVHLGGKRGEGVLFLSLSLFFSPSFHLLLTHFFFQPLNKNMRVTLVEGEKLCLLQVLLVQQGVCPRSTNSMCE